MRFQSTNISLLHMYIYLYQKCTDSIVPISSNVMWNIRNEVDEIFIKTNRKILVADPPFNTESQIWTLLEVKLHYQ